LEALSRLLSGRSHVALYFDASGVSEIIRRAESGAGADAKGPLPFSPVYDSLATEQMKLALLNIAGVAEAERAPSWLDPFLDSRPVRLAQRGIRVVHAIGVVQDMAIALHKSGTLTDEVTRTVLLAVQEVLTSVRRLPAVLFTDSPSDAAVRALLGEIGSGLAALLVRLPHQVVAAAGESVLQIQWESAAFLGRANMRES
jgi:hypothetical protein